MRQSFTFIEIFIIAGLAAVLVSILLSAAQVPSRCASLILPDGKFEALGPIHRETERFIYLQDGRRFPDHLVVVGPCP